VFFESDRPSAWARAISGEAGSKRNGQTSPSQTGVRAAKPWYKILYIQVLIAIVIGVIVGWLWPDLATK